MAAPTFLAVLSDHLQIELSADEVRVLCDACGGVVPADEPLVEDAEEGVRELRCPEDGSVAVRVNVPGPRRSGGYSLQAHRAWIRVNGEWVMWSEAVGFPPPSESSTSKLVLRRVHRDGR